MRYVTNIAWTKEMGRFYWSPNLGVKNRRPYTIFSMPRFVIDHRPDSFAPDASATPNSISTGRSRRLAWMDSFEQRMVDSGAESRPETLLMPLESRWR